jgi:putative membrane protein
MLEEFIASFEHTKKVEGEPKIFSILNVVKEMNQTLNEDKVSLYKLPYNDKELTEMLFLYEVSGGDILKWIDDEYKTARMRVEVKEFDSEEITRNMKILEGRAKEIIPNAKIFLIGNELEFANINSYIVWGKQFGNFAGDYIVIKLCGIFGTADCYCDIHRSPFFLRESVNSHNKDDERDTYLFYFAAPVKG